MALARYSVKVRVGLDELDRLYTALGLSDKIRHGDMTLALITYTRQGSPIERVINRLGCQVATIHLLYDTQGNVTKVFPESIIVGEIMLWRLGHDPLLRSKYSAEGGR